MVKTCTYSPMFGVSRIDDEMKRQHCWFVRLGGSRPKIAKSFADKKYGGKEKSLEAALVFRDMYIEEYRPIDRLPVYGQGERWRGPP